MGLINTTLPYTITAIPPVDMTQEENKTFWEQTQNLTPGRLSAGRQLFSNFVSDIQGVSFSGT